MPSKSQTKFPHFRFSIPRIRTDFFLIGAGTTLILIALAWRVQRSQILSFKTDTAALSSQVSQVQISNPVSIKFPELDDLTLAVTEARITDGTWEISDTGASHWDNSADPGDTGNVVIYGHNLAHLFGPIRNLTVGNKIELTNEQGVVTTYAIEKTVVVEPTQIEYVLPTDEEVLTVYTCTGFLDSKRFIVIATPVEEETN